MAGQIIKRGDRKYLVRVYLGRDDNGKRRYLNKTISGTKKAAEQWLNGALRDKDLGALDLPAQVRLGELFDDILRDYRINDKSIKWCGMVVEGHLRPFFGDLKAASLTTGAIDKYAEQRQKAGASNGTINREFAILGRSLNLGRQATPAKVVNAIKIPKLKEAKPRQGFFEHDQYMAMLRELPEHLGPLLTFAYNTGCRRGEILALLWPQVDLPERTVRLNPGETKNEEGRIIPMTPELHQTLALLRQKRDELYPESPWVFSRAGEPIRNFYKAWSEASKRAGLWDEGTDRATRLLHDARRTGARNLVRAGVPERVVMLIGGWKTRSVFDRYNIVDERDIKDAARKLGAYLDERHTIGTQEAKEPKNPRRKTANKSTVNN
jgi:integrase